MTPEIRWSGLTSAATRSLLCLLVSLFTVTLQAAGPTNAFAQLQDARRIVFLGDSITHAGYYVEAIEAYCVTRFPEKHFEFIDLGLSSETVSGLSEPNHAGGKFPRPDLHERLGRVLAKTKPDLVFLCYGMNDGIYLPLSDERFAAFQTGMMSVREQIAAANAKIIHVTPPVFDPVPIQNKVSAEGNAGFSGPFAGYNAVLDRYSEWLVSQRIAGWDVADLHTSMNHWLAERRQAETNFVFAKDGVHPNADGHWVMAKAILLHLSAEDVAESRSAAAMLSAHPRGGEILKLIHEKQQLLRDAWLTATGHKRPGLKEGLPLPEAQARAAELDRRIRELAKSAAVEAAPFPGRKTAWNGFDRYDFEVNGKPAIVVVPKRALPGKPWLWRGEFFGVAANTDVELLKRGFHLAYLRVPNLFGSPEAVKQWDGFYDELTQHHGFAKKVALAGLSRGGLYCYNWAIANPDKVACVYADAAVCDFKSWPGGSLQHLGKGKGSAKEWAKLLTAYNFTSDAEAIAFGGNPVDNLKPLAEAGIPLLHVYGEADVVVPWPENTGVVAERYRQLGGSITLIPKPGVDHHPHGLSNPTPIVEFILKHATPAQP